MAELRILHTSDWHLGKNIGEVDRTKDYAAFTQWLFQTIQQEAIDVLIVSGDVFDTAMPSSDAQQLYYRFLADLAKTSLRHTVIAAGNHDSSRFLNASRELLAAVRCTVAGNTPDEEAVVIRNDAGEALLGIAAVPFLREGDVRGVMLAADNSDRARLFGEGIHAHYSAVHEQLVHKIANPNVPLIAMGHLFVTGSMVRPGVPSDVLPSSVYVGAIRNVSVDVFDQGWDYVALGHVHNAQTIKGNELIRYSGSPLALNFAHKDYLHQVLLVKVDTAKRHLTSVRVIPVPQRTRLASVEGGLAQIQAQIQAIGVQHPDALVEVVYTDKEQVPDLVTLVRQWGKEAGVRVIVVRNQAQIERIAKEEDALLDLDNLTPQELFKLCLDEKNVAQSDRTSLCETFAEALALVLKDSAPQSDALLALKKRQSDLERDTEISVDADVRSGS